MGSLALALRAKSSAAMRAGAAGKLCDRRRSETLTARTAFTSFRTFRCTEDVQLEGMMANPTTQELKQTTSDDKLATRGRFVWHELMTKDPRAALTFYKQVVGWTTQKWQGKSGTTPDVDYTMFMAGETSVGGVMPIPPEAAAMQVGPSWLAYIAVPDVDLTVDQVKKLGGGVHAPA